MEAKDIKKVIIKQTLVSISDEDIKIMIGELKNWNTKGVLINDGLVLKIKQTLNEELKRARTLTEVNLVELDKLIFLEVAERFCRLNN